ncbi:MAG: hypothetical protein Q9197_000912 [Variospora fuerteventurae]
MDLYRSPKSGTSGRGAPGIRSNVTGADEAPPEDTYGALYLHTRREAIHDRSRKRKAAGEKADQEASDNIEDSDFQEVLYDNHERHRCSYPNSVFARIAYDAA